MPLEIDGGFLAAAGLRRYHGSLTVTARTISWRRSGVETSCRTMMQAVYINLEENEGMQSLSRLERYTL